MGYPAPSTPTTGPRLSAFGAPTGSGAPFDGPPDFVAIQQSPEFAALRARVVRFVFPMTALFLTWYLCYVLLAAYARGFMSHRLWGEINVGLLLGVLQFVSTVLITFGYVRFARKTVDPEVRRIREQAGVTE
jgi:uncharacterized membrane protein (DUF485 family)